MATLYEKVRLVTLGNVHEWLDKKIDLDSPAALKQYVRDLETGLADLRDQAAEAAGRVTTLKRELSEDEHQKADKDALIARLMATDDPNKENAARPIAAEAAYQEQRAANLKAEITVQMATSFKLD